MRARRGLMGANEGQERANWGYEYAGADGAMYWGR